MLALDGVRGIAVLLVLAYHGAREYAPTTEKYALVNLLRTACSIGWCGVDLFFVLSGFLITGILYRSKSRPAYFRNFYARRILRIFPLYYLILAGSLVYGVVRLSLGYSGSWQGLAGGELALWTYTTNLAVGFSGRWTASQPVPGAEFSHFWSLAIEEQFYLVWPLVVYTLSRRRAMTCCAAMAVCALMLRVGLLAAGAPAVSIFVLTLCRMDALAVGGFLALHCQGKSPSARALAVARWVGSAGVLGLVGFWILRGEMSDYDPFVQTAGFALLAIVFTCFVASSLVPRERSWVVPVLELPALRFVGRYSYGAYAYHYILLMGVLPVIPASWWTAAAAGSVVGAKAAQVMTFLGLTLLVAVLSFHLFEEPFLKLKSRFTED